MTLHEQIKAEIPNLEGWVNWERGVEMADLIRKHKPIICVEIGVFGGRSLIAQALALRENGSGKIYGIDPWKKDAAFEGENDANKKWWDSINLNDIHTGTMQAIWRLGLDDQAIVIRCTSMNAWFLFREGIDHLFVDGNHSEVSSCRDVELYVPLVKSGGIIIFDDTDWPSTQKAVKKMDETCRLIRDATTYRIYQKL